MHHHVPPIILEVAFQFDAKRSVIPGAVEAAVNFARLENESAPLTQAGDLFHVRHGTDSLRRTRRAVALRRRALRVWLGIHKSPLLSHRFTQITRIACNEICSPESIRGAGRIS